MAIVLSISCEFLHMKPIFVSVYMVPMEEMKGISNELQYDTQYIVFFLLSYWCIW